MNNIRGILAMGFTFPCVDDNNSSSLAGLWELASPGTKGEDAKSFELFRNGTGVVENMAVSWKIEGKRLAILSSLVSQSFKFKVSGDELTCIEDDGDVSIYARGKKDFKTVKIGGQTWMAENLNCDVPGSKCYNNDPAKSDKYGRLYDWETAMALCHKGWHLPTKAEWNAMTAFIGGKNTEGKKLKATSGWDDDGNGTDDYGFSALPGGCYSDGSFRNVGCGGFWWSASVSGIDSSAYYRSMNHNSESTGWDSHHKSGLLSVRYVQD